MQEIFRELVVLFEQVAPHKDSDKFKAIVCTPVFIWTKQGDTDFRVTG